MRSTPAVGVAVLLPLPRARRGRKGRGEGGSEEERISVYEGAPLVRIAQDVAMNGR